MTGKDILRTEVTGRTAEIVVEVGAGVGLIVW